MKKANFSFLYKVLWGGRALSYKLIFGKFKLFGYIGRPVFILSPSKAFISERVRIFPGLRMEIHGAGEVHIDRNVSIGQNLHLTCRGRLKIGEGTVISGNVMITDIDHEYQDIEKPILDQPHVVLPTAIGQNCFIGYGVCIQAGTTLGRHCIVGANSVVRGNFPNYSVIAGVPAKVIKQYNPDSKVWESLKDIKL